MEENWDGWIERYLQVLNEFPIPEITSGVPEKPKQYPYFRKD